MVGIVGGVSGNDIAFRLIKCLEAMEYRGYDAAGMAVLDSEGRMYRHQTPSRVQTLLDLLAVKPLYGNTGIAKTSWEKPAEKKHTVSKYQRAESIALVMNGIIENKKEIESFLNVEGFHTESESDEEVLGSLIYYYIFSGVDFVGSVRMAEKKIEGFYSACIMFREEPERLVALRRGSSLVLGLGENENFTGSDHPALQDLSRQFIYLEDGDIADIQKYRITIHDEKNQTVSRSVYTHRGNEAPEKGRYSHLMLKDIFGQSDAALSAMQGRLSDGQVLMESFGQLTPELFKKIQRVHIAAEGASFHAALVGRHWIEEVSGMPCTVMNAGISHCGSEAPAAHTLFITISQSGESANTIAALHAGSQLGYIATLTIGNRPESSLFQESDFALVTGEGPETIETPPKSFTAQLCALFLLAVAFGRYHYLTPPKEADLVSQLENIPKKIFQALNLNSEITELARMLPDRKTLLFFGSDIQLPIAMEGASRLTQLSGIDSMACDLYNLDRFLSMVANPEIPVITLAPAGQKLNSLMHKMLEVGNNLVIFADESAKMECPPNACVLNLPTTDRLFSPMTSLIPMQLLAYHVSVLKGTDVDKLSYSG